MSESSDSEQVRQEIEQTREDLGDTIEALKYKTDPREQAKAAARAAAQKTRDLGQKVHDQAPQPVADTFDRTREAVAPKAREAREKVRGREGQVAAAVGAAVVLLLLVRKIARRSKDGDEGDES
jgi:CHASE3 domain sensor protein